MFLILIFLLSLSSCYAVVDDPLKWPDGTDPGGVRNKIELKGRHQSLQDKHYRARLTIRRDFRFQINPKTEKLQQLIGSRTEIPAQSKNKFGSAMTGLGDAFTQLTYYHRLPDRFSVFGGIRFFFPTASRVNLGQGKYRYVPLAGWVAYFPRWFVGFQVMDFHCFRSHRHRVCHRETALIPMLKVNLTDRWFAFFDSDIRINWKDKNKVFIPFTGQIGNKFKKNWSAILKGSVALVNNFARYNWYIEFRIMHFFPD